MAIMCGSDWGSAAILGGVLIITLFAAVAELLRMVAEIGKKLK